MTRDQKNQILTLLMSKKAKEEVMTRPDDYSYLALIDRFCSNLVSIRFKIRPFWAGLQAPMLFYWVVANPKLLWEPFFSIIVLSQPVVMAFRVTKVALLKGRQIAQIQNGIFQGVHNKKL